MNTLKKLCIRVYLEVKELFKSEDIENIPPGETELDYIPKSVPKMKAKRKASKKIKQNENI